MSVSSLPQASAGSPTWSIGFRRARLLTSAAARLSPQTCFRLPHCFGRIRGLQLSRPPALRRADYRLPPVIVLPFCLLMLVLVILVVAVQTNSNASASVLIYLLGLLLYIEIRANTGIVPYMVVIVLLGVSRLLIIPAFGSVANKKIGVGRKSATSVGLTTDLVYWLQAGKTVDISRYASESTDLLPPSALPRLLRSLRLFPPSRPAAGRLPAAAGHRAAVVVLHIHRGGSADVGD